jgi:hypothetical protein
MDGRTASLRQKPARKYHRHVLDLKTGARLHGRKLLHHCETMPETDPDTGESFICMRVTCFFLNVRK